MAAMAPLVSAAATRDGVMGMNADGSGAGLAAAKAAAMPAVSTALVWAIAFGATVEALADAEGGLTAALVKVGAAASTPAVGLAGAAFATAAGANPGVGLARA